MQNITSFLSIIAYHVVRLWEPSRVKRWLLLFIVLVLVALLSYATFRLSHYFEGFEQYGYMGAFLVAFIGSSTVIFPVPGFVVIWAMAASPAFNWAWVALAAGVGGSLGQSTAYLAGYGGATVIAPQRSGWYQRAENWMRRYGGVTIFLLALVPLVPFDLVGIAAGTLRYSFWRFLVASLAGRLPRTLAECYFAYLGWQQLPQLWQFMTGLAWWVWVIIGVCAAAIIGGIIIAWRVWWRKRGKG